MEPADIDWKSVQSRFVRDDLFEHFKAPKWVDLSAPSPFSPGDDDAWFCRPDCNHPKTHEDFLQKPPPTPDPKVRKPLRSAEVVLGERNPNSKPRGVLQPAMTPLLSSPRTKPAVLKKKAREDRGDLENQNPNLPPSTPPKPADAAAAAVKKAAKEAVKSSAERPSKEVEVDPPPRRLRSTHSARNLFAGKEILAQISEFCGEVRRMATLRREKANREGGDGRKVRIFQEKPARKLEKNLFRSEDESVNRDGGDELTDRKAGEHLKLLQQQVRSCPPTPQRFPSPSILHKQKRAAPSPLKPSRDTPVERAILKEVVLNNGEEDNEIEEETKDEGCSIRNMNETPKALDLFWFLKPCTYLS